MKALRRRDLFLRLGINDRRDTDRGERVRFYESFGVYEDYDAQERLDRREGELSSGARTVGGRGAEALSLL